MKDDPHIMLMENVAHPGAVGDVGQAVDFLASQAGVGLLEIEKRRLRPVNANELCRRISQQLAA
jgi:hypothetical protein